MSKEKKPKKIPPKELPISDIAILGLVLTRSHMAHPQGITGKDVLDEMKKANFPDWVDIKYSTVYNCLNRLEDYDYLASRDDVDNDSRKRIKLYQITDNGQEAFLNEIKNYLSTPLKLKDPFDLAIGNVGLLARDDAVNLLASYLEKLKENIKFLEIYVNGLKNGKPGDVVGHIKIFDNMIPVLNNILALFERPYRELLARKEWLAEFIQKLKDGAVFTAENLNRN